MEICHSMSKLVYHCPCFLKINQYTLNVFPIKFQNCFICLNCFLCVQNLWSYKPIGYVGQKSQHKFYFKRMTLNSDESTKVWKNILYTFSVNRVFFSRSFCTPPASHSSITKYMRWNKNRHMGNPIHQMMMITWHEHHHCNINNIWIIRAKYL